MKHSEFKIGMEFLCGDRLWRVTDIGTRVIVAIPLDKVEKATPQDGRITIETLSVFDENEIEGCAPVFRLTLPRPLQS